MDLPDNIISPLDLRDKSQESYYQMKKEGLTDKEILKSLGISISTPTLYRWKNHQSDNGVDLRYY